ncbi:glycosyltransferase [Methyloversatilis discipulorum]|uniref:glycosyltransferase n=1 Tax=Methyloversatilis discipulorum TaxID=1119528 RepID=UPI001A5E7C1E|nr:glycosyltransferase [Methyloversatilis discipulorum]MBL8467685.1 glycosyltransferase family 4 protein [Methyloversatilis discipulorum]
MSRPKLIFVTRSRYWRPGNGEAARTAALIDALAEVCDLTVFFPEQPDAATRPFVERSRHRYRLAVGDTARPERAALVSGLRAMCQQIAPDCVLLSRLQLDFLRLAVPEGVRLVMDTHDLVSDNAASRARAGVAVEEALDFERELGFLRHYDRVLLIQPDDHARVAAVLGERALCVPHPVVLPAQPVRPDSRVIGYAASQWIANRHGLQWFIDDVWPALSAERAELQVAGHIAALLPQPLPHGIRARGFVPDIEALWSGVDVAINPVRWGSGLKIKTVEALAAGLPLVTTREGARGLEDGAGEAFLLADDAAAFADACRALFDDLSLRRRYARAAHAYARDRFSHEACYGGLIAWLCN